LSADETNFVVDVAVGLFAVSLGFSIQFSYNLGVFPTIFVYRGIGCWLHDPMCLASLIFIALNAVFLMVLGAFWYHRGGTRSTLPVGGLGFTLYLICGAVIGVLPWLAYLITRWVAGVP